MNAYMIVAAKVFDREKFIANYAAATAELIAKFGGSYLMRAPGAELLEGDFGDGAGVVISKWPDKASAKKFWNSPEYSALKEARKDLAECQILLVEAPEITAV